MGALGLLLAACVDASELPADASCPPTRAMDWFESVDAFADVTRPHEAFDVLATDADLDGDPDLLVHWHHRGPLELLENRGGRFQPALDAPGAPSKLAENFELPNPWADTTALEAALRQSGSAGVHVWHDLDRTGSWRIFVHAPDRTVTLEIEAIPKILAVEGLADAEMTRRDDTHLQVTLEGPEQRSLSLQSLLEGRLTLKVSSPEPGPPPPLHVGPRSLRVSGGGVEIWKPDPHGIAWLDVEGDAHPEIFVTRGGLMGALVPPLPAKRDRYFRAKGPFEYQLAPAGFVPPGYGRGRRVEWLDADGDGRLELSIGNKGGPNSLLKRNTETGAFREIAQRLRLAKREGEVQAWMDFGDDGAEDLFYLGRDHLRLARPRRGQGARMRHVDGRKLGLRLPRDASPGGLAAAFRRRLTALRFADFDADGDLDLWVIAYGHDGSQHLFRRDGPRFTDVTESLRLDELRGTRGAVLADFDADGFEDAVSFGERTLLWVNCRGRYFDLVPLDDSLVPEAVTAATAADFDGDGRLDVVLAGHRRHLLRNVRATRNRVLEVDLRSDAAPPIGAIVRAHYDDGRVVARRYGSATSSAFSQTLVPLRFGVPVGARATHVVVHWLGGAAPTRTPVPPDTGRLVIERPITGTADGGQST